MSDARAIPEAVQWHEGMLLSPQHFQVASHRAEALLAYQLGTVQPLFWGVRRLAIDEAALIAGLFRVTALEAVLPDGLLVLDHDDPGEPPLEIALAGCQPDRASGTITVQLTVPAAGLALAGGSPRMRYRSRVGPAVVDANTGDNAIEMPRLRPLPGLALLAAPRATPAGQQVALPLARLRPADEGWELAEYEPPRPLALRGTKLFDCGLRIAQRLRAAALTIAERLQAMRAEEGEPPPVAAREAVRALSRGLPRLETQLASAAVHPLDLYLTLCDVVGDLVELAAAPAPAELLPYDHLDALPGFAAIERRVEAALGQLREPFQTLRLERVRDGLFTVTLRAEWLADAAPLLLGVRAGPGQDPARVAEWFRAAIIASAARMRAAIENRTRGAARSPLAAAPEIGFMPSPRVLLHRVAVDPAVILPEAALQVMAAPGADPAGEPQAILLFLPARTPPGAA